MLARRLKRVRERERERGGHIPNFVMILLTISWPLVSPFIYNIKKFDLHWCIFMLFRPKYKKYEINQQNSILLFCADRQKRPRKLKS
jgi:hypothetical protein